MAVNKRSKSFKQYSAQLKQSIAAVQKNLDHALVGIENATQDGVRNFAQLVFDRSQYYVPVDTKALKNSAYIREQGRTTKAVAARLKVKGLINVFVGYDKNNEAPYAVYVHELLEFHHESPTQAKYLETALKNVAPQFASVVGAAIRSRAKKAKTRTKKS